MLSILISPEGRNLSFKKRWNTAINGFMAILHWYIDIFQVRVPRSHNLPPIKLPHDAIFWFIWFNFQVSPEYNMYITNSIHTHESVTLAWLINSSPPSATYMH